MVKIAEIATTELNISSDDLLSGRFPEDHSPDKSDRIKWLLAQLELFKLNYGEAKESEVKTILQFLSNLFMNCYHPACEKLKQQDVDTLMRLQREMWFAYNTECGELFKKKRRSYSGLRHCPEFYHSHGVRIKIQNYELELRKVIDKVF